MISYILPTQFQLKTDNGDLRPSAIGVWTLVLIASFASWRVRENLASVCCDACADHALGVLRYLPVACSSYSGTILVESVKHPIPMGDFQDSQNRVCSLDRPEVWAGRCHCTRPDPHKR